MLLPFAMGALIDMADALTFGPVGLRFGLLIGGILGWVLAKVLGFPPRYRWIAIALSGIYCALPGTAVFHESRSRRGTTRTPRRDLT